MLDAWGLYGVSLIDLDKLYHGLVYLGTLLGKSGNATPSWIRQARVSILLPLPVASAVDGDALDLQAGEGRLKVHPLIQLHSSRQDCALT